MTMHHALLVSSLVCFLLSLVLSESPYWPRLISLGLAALVATMLW